MMLLHDIIKIKYISEGYLPDWPYHLISDTEMFDAFLGTGKYQFSYFHDYYSIKSNMYEIEYQNLEEYIKNEISNHIQSVNKSIEYILPDWIYSYMLGKVIGPKSSIMDRHNLLLSLGLDNENDEFDDNVYREIYDISTKYINSQRYGSQPLDVRPPTIFGEPHVMKYIRLKNINLSEGK